jgi:hypothetical protein
MTNDHDTNATLVKLGIAWVGTLIGGVSLSSLVLVATLVYTLLQIAIVVRKLWRE